VDPVLMMLLVGWCVLAVMALPFAVGLGTAARLQDRHARRTMAEVASPVRLRA
jgi:hypothetical protein